MVMTVAMAVSRTQSGAISSIFQTQPTCRFEQIKVKIWSLVRSVVLCFTASIFFSGFLFRLGVALLPYELSRVHEPYVSRDLLTLPRLVQWS